MQSSVKLDYACKSQNDILIIFFYHFYPEVTFLFKDELSALCHSSNSAKYRVLLDRVIITDKTSLVHPRTKPTLLDNFSIYTIFLQ